MHPPCKRENSERYGVWAPVIKRKLMNLFLYFYQHPYALRTFIRDQFVWKCQQIVDSHRNRPCKLCGLPIEDNEEDDFMGTDKSWKAVGLKDWEISHKKCFLEKGGVIHPQGSCSCEQNFCVTKFMIKE